MYNLVVNHIDPKKAGFWGTVNGRRQWRTRRPGSPINLQGITIHNTGNPRSTALNERSWLENPSNNRLASFHVAIDERNVVECIPLNEISYHAGDRTGNTTHLGIEVCESGNYHQTMLNTVEYVSDKLLEFGLNTFALKQHFDWSGKNCPRLIRAGHMGWNWNKLIRQIEERMFREMVSKYFKDIHQEWQAEHVDSLREKGIISGRTEDTFDPDSPITRAEVAVVVNRAIEYLERR